MAGFGRWYKSLIHHVFLLLQHCMCDTSKSLTPAPASRPESTRRGRRPGAERPTGSFSGTSSGTPSGTLGTKRSEKNGSGLQTLFVPGRPPNLASATPAIVGRSHCERVRTERARAISRRVGFGRRMGLVTDQARGGAFPGSGRRVVSLIPRRRSPRDRAR